MNDVQADRKARHWAEYRLKGMLKNLVEIEMSTPMSAMEKEHVEFAREIIQEVLSKWGTVRWHK